MWSFLSGILGFIAPIIDWFLARAAKKRAEAEKLAKDINSNDGLQSQSGSLGLSESELLVKNAEVKALAEFEAARKANP